MKRLMTLILRRSARRVRSNRQKKSGRLADFIVDARITDGLDAWIAEKGYRESNKNLDDVAQLIGVDRNQLVFYFKNILGTSFTQWRKRMRIEDAKILLMRSDLSCSDVGNIVGFPDKSNFRKRFLDVTGYTPSQWRSVKGGQRGVSGRNRGAS